MPKKSVLVLLIALVSPGCGADRATSRDRLITADSAGPIKLGMTIAEARQAMTTATIRRGVDGEGVAWIDVDQGEVWLMRLYAGEEDAEAPIDENADIEFIEVWSADFRTAAGVHPGMTVSEAAQKYGGVEEVTKSEIESREYAEFTNHPPGLLFRLIHQGDTAGDYQSGETKTTRYRPEATVISIAVIGRDILEEGSIGGIKIGGTEAEVRSAAKGRLHRGEDVIWEVFDLAVQEWTFPGSGLSLDMGSERIGGAKTVFSITVEAPSKLKTERGIGIGAAKADVVKAYAQYKTEPDEQAYFDGQNVHLVGSIFGGMVFTFKDGKVSKIFLGASAE